MPSIDMVAAEVATRLDDLRIVTITDGEVWSARDLMPFAGYTDWRNWSRTIDRAITSVNTSGLSGADHFVGVNRMVELGSGARRQVEDLELSRYACYILFQNADGSKPEIAALQSYFAVQTRKQELAPTTVELDVTSLAGIEAIITAASQALARAKAAESRVEELEPRADAWTALASAEGDYSVGDAAKILARAGIPTGPTRLFNQLRDLKWTYRGGDGEWRAYAERVEKGYLGEKPQFHHHPGTGARVVDAPQVRVTVKGLERLRQRLHVGALQAVVGS